jgi:hypothetical protein
MIQATSMHSVLPTTAIYHYRNDPLEVKRRLETGSFDRHQRCSSAALKKSTKRPSNSTGRVWEARQWVDSGRFQ